jgi:hypothetical protein
MSSINKRISLRIPANVIYRGLRDTRLEQLFPEFFTGATRRLTNSNNETNSGLEFITTTYDSQIQIKEKKKAMLLRYYTVLA